MEEKIQINDDATVAYFEQSGIMIETGVKRSASSVGKPSSPSVDPKTLGGTKGKIAVWGDDNLFPQNVISECESNTIIPSTLDWKARALYSGGLITGKVTYDDNGKEIFKPEKFPEYEEFSKKSNVKRYLIESSQDFYWFYNLFPELILSKDRSKIVSISEQEAAYCRWELQGEDGLIKNCYINANWQTGVDENSPTTTIVPAIDPYYDPVTALRNRNDGFKYIYPVSYPTPGKTYYQLAHWNSIRNSGWLDIAKAIPLFKKSLLKNQISIKYLIRVADYWWTWKYPEWDKFSSTQRKEKIEAELTKFNSFLKGEENAGKSLMNTFKFDPHNNVEYPGWKIEVVDDKIKDGIYIEDSQEASSHMLYALGVDHTIIASAPGKGVGAGSGSDKREAFNMYISLVGIHEDLLLEPLYFIRDYNGWDPDMVFRFKRQTLQTKDQVTPAKREVSNGTN